MNMQICRTLPAMTVALAATAVAALPALTQTQPVVLNHGFANGGSAWEPTAAFLRDQLDIATFAPTTPWHRPFTEQANSLRDQLNGWGRTGAVGLAHSNGGIVGRTYVQQNGTASRYNRVATIGTPHQGAAIATSAIDGRPFAYFGSMAMSIASAFDFYATWDWDFYSHPVVGWAAEHSLALMYNLGAYLSHNNRFIGLGVAYGIPVTWDNRPGSTFLNGLNSAGGLSTESSVLWNRVGISTQVDPNVALFSLLWSNPYPAKYAQRIGAAGALSAYFYYRSHPDWWLANNAYRWLDVYWYLTLMDVAWHDFIGALAGFQYGHALVYRSDGFIPHWSSGYPGAFTQYNLNWPHYHISHTRQKDHGAARNHFVHVLQNDFGVAVRQPDPPPPGGGDTCEPEPWQITCVVEPY